MEELDLPALGIPVELFDGFGRRCYRQISDKPPVDRGGRALQVFHTHGRAGWSG